MSGKREVKIAYIGGGSIGWARHLMADLALSEDMAGEMLLYDIDMVAAEANVKRAEHVFSHPDARTKFDVRAVPELGDALDGADFVIISIQPGPIEMMANDLDIPLKYELLQTVGDTVGPGGISRSLRTIPTYEQFAHKIMSCCPDAWVINYTNPMTLCVSTLYAAEPDIKAFGCCHEVFGTQKTLAKIIEEKFGVEKVERDDVELDITGVNHFTWATAARWDGRDLFPVLEEHISQKGFFDDKTETALKNKKEEKWFTSEHLVAFDLFRRFGAIGAAGDRHLAEFLPWYLRDEKTLHRWGVVATPSSYRIKRWYDNRRQNDEIKPVEKLEPTGEEGVNQMAALLGLRPMVTNVNIPNYGQAPDLPSGAVVESYARFDRDSVTPLVNRPLPSGPAALVRRIIAVQRMTLQAGLERDRELAFQAVLLDPQVNLATDTALDMFNELLEANKDMLPEWKTKG